MTTLRTMRRPHATLDPATANGVNPMALFLLALATAGALLTANPLLSLTGLFGLVLIIKLFWTRRQPAILFWALLHQWLQVNIGVLYANIINQEHSGIFHYKEHADEAYLLGMAGLLAFGLGLWVMTRNLSRNTLDSWLNRLDPKKCFKAYISFIITYAIISSLELPGTGQLIVALGFLKWGFFYIFFSVVLHSGRYRMTLVFCMLLEFVFSLYSIFAGFRAILIMPIILLPVFFKGRFRGVHLLIGALLAALLINVGIVWTAVKQDYRLFMAAGEKGQVINVNRGDALSRLGQLVLSMNGQQFQQGAIAMVYRISYLDFLSGVIGNVPARLPHENGAVAIKALTHIVTPRILFPEKEALHDSVHLNKYIGEYIADYRTTSMSIGYVGDLYVDFGFFAPFAVFLDGLLIGFLYRLLYRQDADPGWGLFLTMPLFFLIYLFEISLIKQLGLLVTYTLVMLLVAKFTLPLIKRSVQRAMISPGAARAEHVNPRRARILSGKRPQWT
jgi:hypothetical protein